MEMLPDTLMVSPCDEISARNSSGGMTVESISNGYVVNTKCVKAHKQLLEKQRQYKKQVMETYGK